MESKVIPEKNIHETPEEVLVPKLSLKINFTWVMAGNIIYAGCQWGMLVIFAKLGSPEMVGQYSLGLAVTAPIIMFSNLNLRSILSTDSREQYHFNDYLGLRLITTVLAFLSVAVVSFIIKISWETKIVILGVGFAKSIESISDIIFGLMQQKERMDRIAISSIIKGLASVLAVTAGLYFSRNLFIAIIAYSIAWGIILLLYDIPNAIFILNNSINKNNIPYNNTLRAYNYLLPYFTFSVLKSLSCLALPLGIVLLLHSIQLNIPRYFVGYLLGEKELGIYSAMSYALAGGILVVQALTGAVGPRLGQYYYQKQIGLFFRIILKLLIIILVMGGVGTLLVWLYGREFLSFVYQPEYAAFYNVFMVLMVAEVFAYVAFFSRAALTAIRYVKFQVPIIVLTLSTSVIMCYLYIPIAGIMGAAFAHLSANLLESLISGIGIGYFLLSSKNTVNTNNK